MRACPSWREIAGAQVAAPDMRASERITGSRAPPTRAGAQRSDPCPGPALYARRRAHDAMRRCPFSPSEIHGVAAEAVTPYTKEIKRSVGYGYSTDVRCYSTAAGAPTAVYARVDPAGKHCEGRPQRLKKANRISCTALLWPKQEEKTERASAGGQDERGPGELKVQSMSQGRDTIR